MNYKKQHRKGVRRSRRRARDELVKAIMGGATLTEDPEGDGFVYVLRLGIGNLYKIGCSSDVKKRVASLMSANPNLSLVFAVQVTSMRHAEKALHTRFAEHRTSHELFELDEETVNELASLFPGAEWNADLLIQWTSPVKRKTSGKWERLCATCKAKFVAKKLYYRHCPTCMKNHRNTTRSGWGRWRNLRTETHEYGEG